MQRFEAVIAQPGSGSNMTDEEFDENREERVASHQRMKESYNSMMSTYADQQKTLANRPEWVPTRTKFATEPDELTVTHVNQTTDLYRADGIEAGKAEGQTSEEWLKHHSIESIKLTLKHLVDKGKICRPVNSKDSGNVQQHIQFEASNINEFEYKLNLAIESFTRRIKWLLQGSKKTFGMLKGSRPAVLVDCSDANFGFGRLTLFQESLTHLIDEQLSKKKSLFFAAFGTEVAPLWKTSMDINCRVLQESKQWLMDLKPRGGCNVLKALRSAFQQKEINTIILILGSVPDQNADVLCDFMHQMGSGRDLPIFTVAYDCSNHQTHKILSRLAEESGGNFHCYSTACEEQLYTGTDISLLLKEIKTAQGILNKIKEMRQGLLGTALVTVMNEICNEVAKLPQSRFLPRPPGHDLPLKIEMPKFNASSSHEWLSKHGLKAKNLDLYQVLAPNAYSYREEFIPVIRKTVQSQVHEKAMAQFPWYDGSIKNIHVDMTQLFEYQKQLGATVKVYEKRIDWLSSSSRKIFGTVTEKNVLILLDLSMPNTNYLAHIQHSVRVLLEQQMAHKDYFNIITFGAEIKQWQSTLTKPTPENLQKCWRWLLDQQCHGSRNFMGALQKALENDEESKHKVEVEGIYLFTSGIPDQPPDVCCSYLEEACAGRNLSCHVILFNVDDYDAQGAIPSRYANITKTAEVLRTLGHCSKGRFHWFRETGIIESDDLAAVSLEIEKALNFSKKCSMLVESVKKKYDMEDKAYLEYSRENPALPPGTSFKALPAPKHTALSEARMIMSKAGEEVEVKPSGFRPSSAKREQEKQSMKLRPHSAKDPMQQVTKPKRKSMQQQFFYTDDKNNVGAVINKYPATKSIRKGIKLTMVPTSEDQMTSKEWLRMYSLSKLKLDLNKLVQGPDCKHIAKPVKSLNKTVEAVYCNIFPTINVAGTLKHLQLLPNELREYQEQVEQVLAPYLKRLQWLLSGSRRVFSTVVEKKCVFLVDTSGSMEQYMEELKKEMASLIWDQLHKHKRMFNVVRFSRVCDQWQSSLVPSTEENCHDAVQWISGLTADGNTCTLEALRMAFEDENIEAVYLLSDGKPDCSTSRVLREVDEKNSERRVVINTISFNCDDSTANTFLKMLAAENGGRYHQCHRDFDAQLFAHKLLTEGFVDHEHPALPVFDGEDLQRLGKEITLARRYLAQSKSYIAMYDQLKQANAERRPQPHDCFTSVGPGAKKQVSSRD